MHQVTNDNIFIQVWGNEDDENTRFTIQLLRDNDIPCTLINYDLKRLKQLESTIKDMMMYDAIPIVQVFKNGRLWRTWCGFQPQMIDEYILNV